MASKEDSNSIATVNSVCIDKSQFRASYETAPLKELNKSPYIVFNEWFAEASKCKDIIESNAMCLSTCNKQGKPSSRMVLMKKFTQRGVEFFSNYQSRKGKEIEENPFSAILFYWAPLKKQVRVEGRVFLLSEEESNTYWKTRPIESQISAAISRQSQEVESREVMEMKVEELRKNGGNIERPNYWGGYLLQPDKFEFWLGHSNRLHDRVEYVRDESNWIQKYLQP